MTSRSPSSPWLQNSLRDGALLSKSPSNAMVSSPIDRSSPNYFGMSTNPAQTSNLGPVQKNWGTSPHQSAHSQIHIHPQELMSAGLKNMLKTEPEMHRLRRESTINESFNGKQPSPGSKPSPSFPLGGFSLGQPSPRQVTGRNPVSAGNSSFSSPHHCR